MWWPFSTKIGPSGFSASSTAEEVTNGIDGTGLTAIVTGASSGIGAETARVLALRGVQVVMAMKSLDAAVKVKETISQQVRDANVDAMELDLSSMDSVRQFAKEFNSSGRPLNILINNAGIMATPFTLSKDGIELQFATNHLGHFLLTSLLLDTMKRTASESHTEGRVINVSSRRHQFSYPEGIRFNLINDKSRYNMLSAYGQSKLANVLHANELARHLKEDGASVTANSLHPGAVATNIFRYHTIFSSLMDYFGKYFTKNVKQGASTTCYLALHPAVKGVSGKYFADNNIAKANALANDSELGNKLWEFSLNLTK